MFKQVNASCYYMLEKCEKIRLFCNKYSYSLTDECEAENCDSLGRTLP